MPVGHRVGFLVHLPRRLYLGTVATLLSCENEDSTLVINRVNVGGPCPSFTVTDFQGTKHTLPDNGKPSLIFFFSTTCNDCVKQFPIIQRLYDKYGSQVHFIGVSRGQERDIVESFMDQNDYSFPASADGTRDVYDLFARQIVPRVYIVSRTGFVRLATTDSHPLTFDDGELVLGTLLKADQNAENNK